MTVPISVATRLFGRVAETMSVPVVGDGHTAGGWRGRGRSRSRGSRPGSTWPSTLAPRSAAGGSSTAAARCSPRGRRPPAPIRRDRRSPSSPATSSRPPPPPSPRASTRAGRRRPRTVRAVSRSRSIRCWPARRGSCCARCRRRPACAGCWRCSPGTNPHDVTTTLRVPIQQAATTALGARYGGVVVLSARTGAVEADAGLGMDALQPPGSSFKTITSAAALTAGKTTLDTTYPYARYALLNGWKLHNFHHEDCGGSLLLAFAVSCNSVFGPLAVSVGAPKLVAMANAFGFNHPASIAYPVPESVTRRRCGHDVAARPRRGRHRPGRRRRDAAADGLGGADDRLGVHAQAAVPDPAAALGSRAARPGARVLAQDRRRADHHDGGRRQPRAPARAPPSRA